MENSQKPLSSDELSLATDAKDREILTVSEYLDVISDRIYTLRRDIVKKELELDDLKQQYKKGRINMNKLKIEKELLERAYWRSKN